MSLWAMTLLSSFAISIGYGVRQRAVLADRIDLRNWLYGIAEVGVEKCVEQLKKEDTTSGYDYLSEDWSRGESSYREVAVGEGTFTISYDYLNPDTGVREVWYGIQDEESKINVNTAEAKVLIRLFEMTAGADEEAAGQMAYGIVDWRDTDSALSHPTDGAEDDDYEDLDFPYEAKDRPFEVLNELLLVRGMTLECFEKVRPWLTVYGGGAVNINTASREVLLALGIEDSVVSKILAYRNGTDRQPGTGDDQAFVQTQAIVSGLTAQAQLSAAEAATVSNLAAAGTLGVSSSHFMIHSVAQIKRKNRMMEITAVAERSGKIFYWSSGIPRRMSIRGSESSEPPSTE